MTSLMTLEHAGADEIPVDVANYARRWWSLVVLAIAQLMVILDGTIVNIALPRLSTICISPTPIVSGSSPHTRLPSEACSSSVAASGTS